MNKKYCSFDQVQLLGQQGVEEDGDNQSRNDEKRTMPCFIHIPVVVEYEKALDLRPGNKCGKRDPCLPA